MIVAVALVGSRRTLGVTAVPLAPLSSPKNVSAEDSWMPSSMIWMDTFCTESLLKTRTLEVLI